jgi:hypothetical protein
VSVVSAAKSAPALAAGLGWLEARELRIFDMLTRYQSKY